MNTTIDQEGCTKCGACVDACAEVFELRSRENAGILKKYRTDSPAEGKIGEDLSDCARSGAEVCGPNVIHLM